MSTNSIYLICIGLYDWTVLKFISQNAVHLDQYPCACEKYMCWAVDGENVL